MRQPPPKAGGYRPPPGFTPRQKAEDPQDESQGEAIHAEYRAPETDGRKAVVELSIRVFVEVPHTGDYWDMVDRAKDDVRRRVVEAPTFWPASMESERVHPGMTVPELKDRTMFRPQARWDR
jgi:hypothetical protein